MLPRPLSEPCRVLPVVRPNTLVLKPMWLLHYIINGRPASRSEWRVLHAPTKLSFVTVKLAKYVFQPFKLLSSFCEFAFGSQALVIVKIFAGFGNQGIGVS